MKRISVRLLWIIFLSACIFPWPVLANATPTDYIWEEGEIQGLVPMKSDNIAVDKETLIYHIQADPAGFYADVQVTYLLRNTSLTSQPLSLAFITTNLRSSPEIRCDDQQIIPLNQITAYFPDQINQSKSMDLWEDIFSENEWLETLFGQVNHIPFSEGTGESACNVILFQVQLDPGQSLLEVSYQEQAAHRVSASDSEGRDKTWGFYYFLQPASNFKEFGDLNIQVTLPEHYKLETSLDGFLKRGTVYTISLPNLPSENVQFLVSRVPPIPFGILFLGGIIFAVFCFCLLVFFLKRQK